MSETIFSKIINGDIPCYKVYENEHVLAFLDITQVTKGHTLLIPKTPVSDVFAWSAEIGEQLGRAIPIVANAIQNAFPDMVGLNMVSNNKEGAYQTVFHSHLHLIPRYSENDDFKLVMHSHQEQFTPQQMNDIAQLISKHIKE
ncbi:HIT family protein [Carnobacteriaceae bacterium zg-ZUI252]|nr:HIT family protein [Carnobacteriaceae bacterium zg-ZUI252]MBS4769982.1 HIT family protein [Carnobacteriaceae bacterium zg-ZUI240]